MAVTTEPKNLRDLLLREMEDRLSREKATILSGNNVSIGQVMARILKEAAADESAENSGDATIALGDPAILPKAEFGSYSIECLYTTSGASAHSITKDGTGDRDVNVTSISSKCPLGVYQAYCYDASATPTFAVYDVDGNYLGDVLMNDTTVDLGVFTLEISASGGSADYTLGDQVNIDITDTGATQLSVTSPSGESLPLALLDTEYTASDHVKFTVNDGSSGISSGDAFNVTILEGSKKLVPYDPTGAYDGREQAVALPIADYDASEGDVTGVVIVRNAIVLEGGLVWIDGLTTAQKNTAIEQFENAGIQVKAAV